MPADTEPSCIRHDVCMYWVRRLFGSTAWTVSGSNNAQVRQAASVAAIAVRGRLKRSRSGRREAVLDTEDLDAGGMFAHEALISTCPNI
jgi:hypothetical protein